MSAEMDTLIDTFLDGDASESERDALAAWLGEDSGHRDHFVRRSRLHWSLRGLHQRRSIDTAAARMTRSGAGRAEDADDAMLPEARIERNTAWSRYGSMLAAAAVVAIACTAVVIYAIATAQEEPTPAGPAFVSVIDSTGNLYMGETFGITGSDYPGGNIELTHGSAEFMLSNRVSVRLRGATRLTMSSPMSATVHKGQAAFSCPTEASGFTVYLPGGWSVVDRSTAFEVIVRDDGRLAVVATEGLIELRGPHGSSTQLIAGQGRVIDAAGQLSVDDPWLRRRLGEAELRRMDGLIALYNFDSSTNDAELFGDAKIIDGPLDGHALSLGGNGRARTGKLGVTGSFTLMAWVRPDRLDATFHAIVMTDVWGPAGVHWQLENGRPNLAVGPNTILSATDPLRVDEWCHLAATVDMDARVARVFADGRPVGELRLAPDSHPSIPEASIGVWRVPGGSSSRPFVGQIDDLAVFDRPLGDDEIRQIYETTQLRSEGTADPPSAASESGASAEDTTE